MKPLHSRLTLVALAALAASSGAGAAPVEGKVTEFPASSGLVEQCIRIQDFPDAHYSGHDRQTEERY